MKVDLFFAALGLTLMMKHCSAIWSIADVVVYLGVAKSRANYEKAAAALGCPRTESRLVNRRVEETECFSSCFDFVSHCYFGHISVELEYSGGRRHLKTAVSTVKGTKAAVWKELDNQEDVGRLVQDLCRLEG